MHLFFKHFSRTISLVMFVLALFGSMLLYSSFKMSLKEELKQMSNEVEMVSYALNSSLAALPSDYEAVDYAVEQIADSVFTNRNTNDIVRIYNESDKEIYTSKRASEKNIKKTYDKQKSGYYEILSSDNNKYLHTFTQMDSSRGKYYLEINRDISVIYENRQKLYSQYVIVLSVGIVLSVFLSIIFTISFTRPLIVLSNSTKKFADGNYKERVKIIGDDEISVLMQDFNSMAERLNENMQKLEYQAKTQEEFTAAFAHELKTPLTSIIGYSDMLRSMELSGDDIRMCGEYIFNQGSRLEKLSYKLLELVGIDKHKIIFKQIQVKPLVQNVEKIMQKQLEDNNIVFETNIDSGFIAGDEDLIISLLCNIIDNGRKACRDLEGKIILSGVCCNDEYIFSVEDNGCGMPADELEKIKEAFYMVDKSRARKEGGAGIGMALCDKIVGLHNANWTIKSELHKGTKVTISFPVNLEAEYEKI